MKLFYSLLFSACCALSSYGQSPTYNGQVGQIIREKCAACHKNGGIAPFPLMEYEEAAIFKSFIHDVVTDEIMPPWPPDSGYQSFVHERSLTTEEKTAILNWIHAGAPEGDEPPPPYPVFPDQGVLGTGDLTLKIPPYRSKATSGGSQHIDDYVCFTIPSELATPKIIEAMEVIPGDREIVHHALVYIDSLGNFPTDTVGRDCGGPQDAMLIGGYAPGGSPTMFANSDQVKMGMTIPAGANIILAMHYPDGSEGRLDTTQVNFHFYDDGQTGVREVSAAPLIQDWSMSFAPGETDTLHQEFPAQYVLQDYTVLSVFPHMHQIGKSIETYAIPLNSTDTIPFIKISDWDFEWQDFYAFKNPVKLPALSTIKGTAIYHNHTDQVVTAGLNTTDEMFLIYYQYLPYQSGDENLDMEELLSFPVSWEHTGLSDHWTPAQQLEVFPVPVLEGHLTVVNPSTSTKNTLTVYDMSGKVVQTTNIPQGKSQLELQRLPSKGTYVISVGNGKQFWHRLVTQ